MTRPWYKELKARPRVLLAAGALVIFGAGIAIGAALGLRWQADGRHERRQMRLGGYRFINPLLECEVAGDQVEFSELTPFKDKVAALVNKKLGDKTYSHVSVYFRDLNNGPWFGINEREPFAPASLLKVPTMMALLKEAEQKPGLLSEPVTFSGEEDFNDMETFKPPVQLERGKSYTVDELIFRSIAYSDNNANTLVFGKTDKNMLVRAYMDLGVPVPSSHREDFMSVRQYASFFRILFNASYLSREMSEKALDYLSRSAFRNGIVAGVPAGVAVAHKFGERTSAENPGVRQLHDCGIVYYPGHPYLLCIMSRGDDFGELDDIIREISRIVFEEIGRQREEKAAG